jgi:hypothetical protein
MSAFYRLILFRIIVCRSHNRAEVYLLKVAELEIALNDDSIKAEAGDILRTLIDRVVLTPSTDASDGIEAQLHGDLVAILALSNDDRRKQKLPAVGVAGSLLSVVAGHAATYTERSFRGHEGLRSILSPIEETSTPRYNCSAGQTFRRTVNAYCAIVS